MSARSSFQRPRAGGRGRWAGVLLAGLLGGGTGLHAGQEFLVLTSEDGGPGSLRDALRQANTSAGRDRIRFLLPPDAPAIVLTNALPVSRDAVLIDGWSQPGATRNGQATGSDAVIPVAIDGSALPPGSDGLVLQGPDCEVRGLAIYGFRADADGAGGTGIVVECPFGGAVHGCFLGVRPDGVAAPNDVGVWLRDGIRQTVGGPRLEDRNVIRANLGPGIRIEPGADQAISRNEIRGNEIADNGGAGVFVSGSVENAILSNAIQDNGGLGIELADDGFAGPDQADMFDRDTGANEHQNFPILEAAIQTPDGLRLEGRLLSAPEARFTVQVFANAAPDPSGFGEGAEYLGEFELLTDANGQAFFSETLAAALADTDFVTGTATDEAGNTSEFSAAQVVIVELDTLADAAMELTAAPTPAPLGGEVTLTLRAVDRSVPAGGFGELTNRVITLTLPPELTLLEAPERATVDGGQITLTNVTIPAAGAAAFPVKVRAELPGRFPVVATVSDDGPRRGNNRAALDLEVLNANPPQLGIADATVVEGDAGETPLLLNVTLSEPATERVTFEFATVPGEATPGEDYRSASGLGGILPGEQSTTIAVSILGDELPEPTETFTVRLSQVTGALVERGEAQVSIEDNDQVTLLSVDLALEMSASPEPVAVGESLVLTLLLTNLGPDDAIAARVTLPVPDAVELLGATGGVAVETNEVQVTFDLDTLPAGSNATFTVELRPNLAGTLTNHASVELLPPPGGPPAVELIDPDPANNLATTHSTVRLAMEPVVPLATPAFNPQTGLFEQWVHFFNLEADPWPAVRVFITGLPEGATVYNAAGATEGEAFIQYNAPVAPGGDVLFLVEFYVPDRQPPDTPTYRAVPTAPQVPPDFQGPGVPPTPDRAPAILGSGLNAGRFLLEFRADPGARYVVQYRDSFDAPWLTAVPALTAPADVVQWFDDGPPKTDRSPADAPARFYRVILLPPAADSPQP